MCTVNYRPTASNYQLSHLRPCGDQTPASEMGGEPVKFDNLAHSETIIEKESVFQGHLYPAHTIADATQALRSLAQNDDIAKNDYWIYAYNITGLDGQVKCAYSDDEWKTGTILMELLKEKGLSEVILIVTRKYGGIKLGKKRFELIKKLQLMP